MILRHLSPSAAASTLPSPAPSATEVFLASQHSVVPPFAVVLQIAHSQLTGELAQRLLPNVFGELPPEAIEAAWKHDLGWADSDARQMNLVPNVAPKPFPVVAADDEVPAWMRSLTFAESMRPLTRVLISRHFCALAGKPSAQHDAFLSSEEDRRTELEDSLDASFEDLERWTGAVGFCDLLSLYLCSGLTESVTFPLAHPADPDAEGARHVTLSWKGEHPVFSEPIFQPGTELRVEAQRYEPGTGALHPLAVQWSFG